MKNKKGIVFILLLSMLLSSVSPAFATAEVSDGVSSGSIAAFSDTNGHWAKSAIEKWSGYGVISGYKGLFRPNDSITRGEMAVILNNMMDYKISAKNKFTDLPAGQFYTDAMLKANAAGIILGDGSTVRPTDKISREEAAVMLARAFAVKESSGSAKFNDAASVASWAKGYVVSMEEKGYINGSNNSFQPKAKITRAEIVTIINNTVKAYYTKAGTYTENVNGTAVVKVTGVTLKGANVTGNLIIAEGVGEGEATLDSVTVKGETVVRGGGENSVHITGNSNITSVRIEKVNDKIRIVVADGSSVKEVEVAEGEEIIITGKVGTLDVVASDTKIIAKDAEIAAVTVASSAVNTSLNAESGSTIAKVTASAPTNVSGTGNVTSVVLNQGANNSKVTTPKTQTTVGSGVSGVTGGGGTPIPAGSMGTNSDTGKAAVVQGAVPPPVISGGVSGGSTGGSGAPSTVAVSSISVTGPATYLAINTSMQMSALVSPSNASNKTVTWSVTTQGGAAVIDSATGMLTGTALGVVRVIATNTASGVTGYRDITIMSADVANRQAVTDAAVLVNGATYTMPQTNTTNQAAAKAAVQAVIALLQFNGVTATVNDGTYTAAFAGTYSVPNGTPGAFTFTVTLEKGAISDTTSTLTMSIAPIPFDTAAADRNAVTAAAVLIEGATYSMPQSAATNEGVVLAAIEGAIDAMSLNGVGYVVNKQTYTPAQAGTYTNPTGTPGAYSFTVALTKNSASRTTAQRTMTIVPTVFDVAAADLNTVTAAAAQIQNAVYTIPQASAGTAEAARGFVASTIGGMNLDDVVTTVTGISFTAATAGSISDHIGANGSYRFTVDLAKGSASRTTNECTAVIVATPYDSTADDLQAIASAAALIENGNYRALQVSAGSIDQAKSIVVATIGAMNLNGVTATVTSISFTQATAGSAGDHDGVNGSYRFAVDLAKGSSSGTTNNCTMEIIATPYDSTADDLQAVSIAAVSIKNTNFDIPHVNANNIVSAAAFMQTTIDEMNLGVAATVSALTFADAVDGTSGNHSGTPGAFAFSISLEKGAANKTITSSAVIVPVAYSSAADDLQAVMVGKNLLQIEVFTIPHASANTAASASAIVKTEIDLFPELAGITTSISAVSFEDAVDGTSECHSGTPGAFKFTVTLTKNQAATTTAILNATITAVAFDVAAADLLAVGQAKATILSASNSGIFMMTQEEATTESAVIASIAAIVNGLDLQGSTPEIAKHCYITAIEGSQVDPDGTNGYLDFEVILRKGDATTLSGILRMNVIATPYTNTKSTKMTIMVYADGDNDLEANLITDINEMKAGVTDDVNLIVLADRVEGLPGGTDDSLAFGANFTDTRLYQIKKNQAIQLDGGDKLPQITTSSSFEGNMGDATLLKGFVDYCKTYFPASKSALILWNHGGGAKSLGGPEDNSVMKDICADHTVSSGAVSTGALDILYTAEITDVLGDAEDVDILGFDACLMGTAEVAYQYRPKAGGFDADLMIASAPNEWGNGWSYAEILARLSTASAGAVNATDMDNTLGGEAEKYYDPATIDNATFGAIVVEEFRDSITDGYTNQSLACYDLTKIQNVKAWVDDLAMMLYKYYPTTNSAVEIQNIRDTGIAYFDKSTADNWISTPVFDLYDLATRLASAPALSIEATGVKNAVNDFVLYSYGGPSYNGFANGKNGVSILFPNGAADYSGKFGSGKHWSYLWWYNPYDTTVGLGDDFLYGKLDWCNDYLSPTDAAVTNWFELLDYWYDDLYGNDQNAYSSDSDDNTIGTANELIVDGEPYIRTLLPGVDVDWFKFTGEADKLYTIDTVNLSSGTDTVLTLYDTDGTTMLMENDDYEKGNPSSEIQFLCTTPGSYFIKVNDYATQGGIGRYDIVATESALAPDIIRMPANPAKGFNYDYFIFMPQTVTTSAVSTSAMMVEMLNCGQTISYADAVTKAYGTANSYRDNAQDSFGYVAEQLQSPIVIPCIERPVDDGLVYTHALDRDSVLNTTEKYSRVHTQVKNMIEDAHDQLESQGYQIENKVFMNGFSASGQFAHRFTVLYPDLVKATAAGGLGGLITVPFENTSLITSAAITPSSIDIYFPIGVYDLQNEAGLTTSTALTVEAYKAVPQFYYQGANDENYPIDYTDSYSSDEQALIKAAYGVPSEGNLNTYYLNKTANICTNAGVNLRIKYYDVPAENNNGHDYHYTNIINDILYFFRNFKFDGE